MADYASLLKEDLVEQFKEKPVIDAIIEAVGDQLTDVFAFFEDLRDLRGVKTSFGKQLDGVGDIAVLSRKEAGELACYNRPSYVLNDEEYRKYLIYKIWRNTCTCTYPDIIKAFRMFWDKPLYYREDPAEPATMLFETDELAPEDNAAEILTAPIVKAAGVGIKIKAVTVTPEMCYILNVTALMGRGYMSTVLPEYTEEVPEASVYVRPASGNITETRLPEYGAEVPEMTANLAPALAGGTITQTILPEREESST